MRKKFGVATNDADYPISKYEKTGSKKKQIWICPFYSKWNQMLTRCYGTPRLLEFPSYKGAYVCEDWLLFSNFRSWMEGEDWVNKHLDKDLLGDGKEYAPDKCAFLHPKVNTFLCDSAKSRGEFPLGVTKSGTYFTSRCNNPFTSKTEYLGSFDCPPEAHLAWKKRKHELACQLADSDYVEDERVAQALRTRYL